MKKFPKCKICNSSDWKFIYEGDIRNGAFGNFVTGEIKECITCKVQKLNEEACVKHSSYEGTHYRDILNQGSDINNHLKSHDKLVEHSFRYLWNLNLRGKTVADIGCGGGSFLDYISNVSDKCIGVEPNQIFSKSLKKRGYEYFSSSKECIETYKNKIDVIVSTQVIEHVEDPKKFLKEIKLLLKPKKGIAMITTPNRDEILMRLIKKDFSPFFYRAQHRWNFNKKSLINCAVQAGFNKIELYFIHRYGISNTFNWLKDKLPKGDNKINVMDNNLDNFWISWLESKEMSDNLCLMLKDE
jgi:SAM-dependent methyltransferase